MITPPSRFKTVVSVALVVAALALVAFGVMPAQAQGLNFSLQLPGGAVLGGDDPSLTAPERGSGQSDPNRAPASQQCLSDREVRRGVEANGYSNVQIARELSNGRVEVQGQNGNWLYSMRVDRCTGQTERVQRIQRLQGGGFGLQFNFGN